VANKKTELDRRDFLKGALAAGAGASALGLGGLGNAEAAAGDSIAPPAAAAAKVPRKLLGSTGQEIPILLLGCAQKFDARYDKILHRCLQEGVDYLDTALVYANGQSHLTIAPFLKQVGRDKIWITSKAPTHDNTATPAKFEEDFQTCLDQLETDHLDLFFMHALKDEKYLEPQFLKMGEKLKKQGKTRFFGFSCHDGNVVELMNKAAKVGGIDAIMFRYHFGKYGDKELNLAIDACKKAGIGLIAMKTQKSVPADQKEVDHFESKDFNLAQAKLKAVWADERIDSVVSHMDDVDKVKENIAAAKSPVKLSLGEMQQLNRMAAIRPDGRSCEGCSHHCEPVVEGEVKIADTLRFLTYHECYGETEKARAFYRELAPAQRASAGVDFTAAEAACPEGIDIATRLERARNELA
jgi:predicted aldo/keto reductase-like oxidoreductase